jgi:hypothetical protein
MVRYHPKNGFTDEEAGDDITGDFGQPDTVGDLADEVPQEKAVSPKRRGRAGRVVLEVRPR